MKRQALIDFLTAHAVRIGHELLHKEQLAELLPREQQPDAWSAIRAGREHLCARFRDIGALQVREVASPGT